MDQAKVRKDFPQLNQGFIYFDSGSTALKPLPVIRAVEDYYKTLSTSVGRGLHRPSNLATKAYAEAHEKVRRFLNGSGDLVFTKNCTEAINIVSHGIDWKEGDKVITTCLEHNSNLLPWLALKSKGVEVVILECSRDGTIDLGELAEAVDEKTRIVAVIHASNVLGTIVPVADIAEIVRKKGAMLLIDGAQSTPHLRVDVDKLGCDFYAGSGHKMCGPSGTGFLYINKGVLDQVRPMMLGGGSATDVQPDQITFTKGPGIFEAGTPNIAGGIGLGAAADYLESLGMDEIRKHEIQLSEYLIEKLKPFSNIEVYGPVDLEKRTGVVSFNVNGIPAHRIAILLDEIGDIAIRSGNHCAFLLTHHILGQPFGTARASFYFYNTIDEIDRFIDTLKDVIK